MDFCDYAEDGEGPCQALTVPVLLPHPTFTSSHESWVQEPRGQRCPSLGAGRAVEAERTGQSAGFIPYVTLFLPV